MLTISVVTSSHHTLKRFYTVKETIVNLKKKTVILPTKMGLFRNSRQLQLRHTSYSKTIGMSREQKRGTPFYRGRAKLEGCSKQKVH